MLGQRFGVATGWAPSARASVDVAVASALSVFLLPFVSSFASFVSCLSEQLFFADAFDRQHEAFCFPTHLPSGPHATAAVNAPTTSASAKIRNEFIVGLQECGETTFILRRERTMLRIYQLES